MTPLKPSGLCVVLVQLCPCDAFREEVGAVRPIVGRVTECLLENMLMDPSAGIATCTTDDLGGGTAREGHQVDDPTMVIAKRHPRGTLTPGDCLQLGEDANWQSV